MLLDFMQPWQGSVHLYDHLHASSLSFKNVYEVQYKKVRRCLKWRSSSESGAVQFFQFSEYNETEQKAQLHLGLAKTDTGRDLAMSGEGRKGGKVKGNHSFGSIYDLHVCLPPNEFDMTCRDLWKVPDHTL